MNQLNRQTQTFFFSQDFADAVRLTLGVLVPALAMAWYGYLETGIIASIGALCVSITDSPGPVTHRRNAMLLCSVCLLVVGTIAGLAASNPFLAGAIILGLGFFFSMFAVYGNRASALGSAAILLMILMLDQPLDMYLSLGTTESILRVVSPSAASSCCMASMRVIVPVSVFIALLILEYAAKKLPLTDNPMAV